MILLGSRARNGEASAFTCKSKLVSRFILFQLPDRQLYNWVFSVSASVRQSVSPHFRLGPIFSQVFQWIATKLGMCIHLSMVLDEFKGIFDLTPFRGHFGLKTQKKLAIYQLGPIFSQVFGWIATKLGMCIHLSMVLHEFKVIFDQTPFKGYFGLKTQKKSAILQLGPIFSQVFG